MWLKIKSVILAHSVQSVVVALVVVVGAGGVSYSVLQNNNPSDNTTENTSNSSIKSCVENVKIGAVLVEKDPANDPEAWLRFDYTTTANQAINCHYMVTFYDNQNQVIRTISDVEDTFQSPSGQIYNGYSSTPYQSGMTAKVIVK